jgi:hypothetical protein
MGESKMGQLVHNNGLMKISLFFFLFVFLMSVVTASPAQFFDYAQPQASSSYYSTNQGWLNQWHDFGGYFNPTLSVYEKIDTPTNYFRTPLIGNINNVSGMTDQPYVVKDTGTSIVVEYFNSTTGVFQTKASYSFGLPILSPLMLIADDTGSKRNIVAVTESDVGTSKYNISIFQFNGTALNKVCQSGANSITLSPKIAPMLMGYDEDWKQIIIYGAQVGDGKYSIGRYYGNNCTEIQYQTSTYSFSRGYVNEYNSYNYYNGGFNDGLTLAQLRQWESPAHHNIIVRTTTDGLASSGIAVFSYTQYGVTDVDTGYNGEDTFNADYTCTSGQCYSVSDSYRESDPIYDPVSKLTFVATDNQDLFASCGNYCLLAMDESGNSKWWSTSGYYSTLGAPTLSYLHDECGDAGATKNITMWQPALIDLDNDAGHTADAVCGVCQPSCVNYPDRCTTAYIACYGIYDGKEKNYGSVDLGYNYYVDGFTDWNTLLVSNFDRLRNTNDKILLRDKILNGISLDVLYDFGYEPSSRYVGHVFGQVRKPVSGEATNPWIGFFSNNSNIWHYTLQSNSLPQYIPGSFDVSPCSDTPICLDFVKNQGVKVTYGATDQDSDTILGSHYCDINSGNYYNFTNWTALGGASNTYYCMYNQTGNFEIVDRISDDWHKNTSYTEQAHIIVQIINSTYPSCQNSYSCKTIVNPLVANVSVIPDVVGNATTPCTGLYGCFNRTLNDWGVNSEADKSIIAFAILFILTLVMVFLGVRMSAPMGFYVVGIPLVDTIFFLAFLVLGMFNVWMVALILVVIAIIGAFVVLKFSGQSGGSEG